MSFVKVLRHAREVLREEGRLSLRGLSRELGLEGDEFDELVEELVEIQGVARIDGKAIVWCAEGPTAPGATAPPPVTEQRNPLDYTPKHLADKILRSKSAIEGERKHVTVIFADVKGSMDLAAQVDAEQWHLILDRFFAILAEGVHRFEGTVNQFTGDGIMALFGAPIAHEDHAQRACYASLHLLEQLRGYALEVKREHGIDFAVRIGMNSGNVVIGRIGDDLRMDYTAQGHTVGLAQRMETLAEPNSCALSEATAKLVSGYFELEDLGGFTVKGVADPVAVFALRGVGAARTRLDLSRSRGFTKFVGRDREMNSLDTALEEAIAGNGQVVGIVAQAGTGKSRLCHEFVERCRARGLRVNEAHCPAHGKTVAYLPLLEMLRSIFEISDRESDHEARRKIAGELLLLDSSFHDLLPLVFDFLGVPDPERPAPELPPEARQRQMMAFVRHLTQARSEQQPSVLLVDDLHWIDPGSDAFLAQTIEAVHDTRTLFLVNFRPEYHADWMAKSYYRQLPLAPLGIEAVEALLLDLLGADESTVDLAERIHDRTGGNPFFIEEVVQTLIESGALEGSKGSYRLVGSADSLELPATVQSVLAARIDRLPEREKQLLQTASVIGKEVPEPILSRVVECDEEELRAGLAELVRCEFVFEKALYPTVVYAFKHPLTHEVAYQSQLGDRRKRTHALVAGAIEAVDADSLDERAALLAHHWEQSGDAPIAARWHRRAAYWCANDSPTDALRHWQRVRALLADVPGSQETRELRLEAAIENLNMGWRHGLSEEETDAAFEEGRALAAELGNVAEEVRILVIRSSNFGLSGEPAAIAPLAKEIARLAAGNAELEYLLGDSLMNMHYYLGDLQEAVDAATRKMELAREAGIVIDALDIPAVWYDGYKGAVLTEMGRLDEAFGLFRAIERPLRDLNRIQPLSWWSGFASLQYSACGLSAEALSLARRAIELADEVASPIAIVVARNAHGEASLSAGDWAAALQFFGSGLELSRKTRSFLTREASMLAGLSRAQLGGGDKAEAFATAQEAIRVGVARQTPVFELHGQLSLAYASLEMEGPAADEAFSAALERSTAIIETTEARLHVPHVHELRARLSAKRGDLADSERELREAQRVFSQIGASGHASRIAREFDHKR